MAGTTGTAADVNDPREAATSGGLTTADRGADVLPIVTMDAPPVKGVEPTRARPHLHGGETAA